MKLKPTFNISNQSILFPIQNPLNCLHLIIPIRIATTFYFRFFSENDFSTLKCVFIFKIQQQLFATIYEIHSLFGILIV